MIYEGMEIKECAVSMNLKTITKHTRSNWAFCMQIQSLDLHLRGKFVDGLLDKLRKLGNMFVSKQDNGLQQK